MCVDDEVLHSYLDGELQEPWRTQVAQHLSYCKACRKRVEELKDFDQMIRSQTLSDECVAEHQARVLSFFEQNRFSSSGRTWFRKRVQIPLVPALLTSAAAFIIVFIGAFALFGTNGESSEILPGVAAPLDSEHVRQVSDESRTLDDYSLEQIVQYLDSKGYVVTLEVKTLQPLGE